MDLKQITQALKYFFRSLKRKLFGQKKFKGNAKNICKSIIDECWNGKYFQTSIGNYREFWARDFGWCTQSLLDLGYQKEVKKTLEYALEIYSKHNKISTTITNDKPFSFPNVFSIDSVAFLFHSLRLLNEKQSNNLIERYKPFLINQIKLTESFIENDLVKRNTLFSGMRDYAVRDSSCYDNIMIAFLSDELDKLSLPNPFKKVKQKIKQNFWIGSYFKDQINDPTITGDANLFPFWTNVFSDQDMLEKAIQSIEQEKLDIPFPLKYSIKHQKMIFQEFVVPNWETHAIWCHMGPLYIQILKKINPSKAQQYIEKYKDLIETHKTVFEVFDSNGNPYKSLFYYSDEGMLWAANILKLL